MFVRVARPGGSTGKRDKTKVITFRVPHNAAVQIYDYKQKKARVVFGPDMVMLKPDEQFTQLSLSGGKPKRPNTIKSLCLLLGPDFCTDIITIETSDHARLSLQLSYNWWVPLCGYNGGVDRVGVIVWVYGVPIMWVLWAHDTILCIEIENVSIIII